MYVIPYLPTETLISDNLIRCNAFHLIIECSSKLRVCYTFKLTSTLFNKCYIKAWNFLQNRNP